MLSAFLNGLKFLHCLLVYTDKREVVSAKILPSKLVRRRPLTEERKRPTSTRKRRLEQMAKSSWNMTNDDLVFHYGYREQIMTVAALSSVQQFFANRSSPDVMIRVSQGILSQG